MGCDIHFTLFARKLSNGKKIDLRFKNYKNIISKDDLGETVWFEDNEKCYSKYHHLFEDFIDGRSYFLFGILSGVRSNEYYEDSRYRRYINIDSDKFKSLKELGCHSFTLFKANGLRKLLKKVVKQIIDNEIIGNENIIDSINSGDYSSIYSDSKDVNMKEVKSYMSFIKNDIEQGYYRAESVQELIDRINEYQNTVKNEIPDVDSNSLEIFVWYDS